VTQPWLTDAEIADLTGYVQPCRQIRWLEQNRIKHFVNRLQKPRVPRDILAKAAPTEKRTEPDFTKVRKANGAN